MTEYRRLRVAGATWFFTATLAERDGNRLLVENIDLLRRSFAKVKEAHPFRIDAIAILPDHLHCIRRDDRKVARLAESAASGNAAIGST